MKKRVGRIIPKSKYARKMVDAFGQLVQIAGENSYAMKFTDISESDPWNFQSWAFWLNKGEFDWEEFVVPQ